MQFDFDSWVHRQYRGNEGQMRELQDQLEAEQYFSVSIILSCLVSPCYALFVFFYNCENQCRNKLSALLQTLYKTQVKELKEEIEEKNRQVQEAHKKVQDLCTER